MFGFVVTNSIKTNVEKLGNAKKITFNSINFYYNPLPKFEGDKLFFEDDEKVVLLDGVIFNNRVLMDQYSCNDWQECFLKIYAESPENFMDKLRGSFCGVILRKKDETIFAFENQSGEKPIYYTNKRDFFVIASHNNLLLPIVESNGINVEPDVQGFKELTALGYCAHGNTPFKGVKRLLAGKVAYIDNGCVREARYHMFRNVPEHELSLEECVEEFDRLYRAAIKRIYSKNEEYGYQGECDLSGGLDSRMATWVAADFGYKNILNVCYCMSGNLDHTISKKIASDLGNKYYFLPMDGGEILKDVEEVVDKFGGQVSYIICTGANRAMKEISKHNIGLSITGMLGGCINAYYTEGDYHTPANFTTNKYSTAVEFTEPDEYKLEYDNYEQLNLYEFSNLLLLSSLIIRQQVVEATSPLIDVEFLEFVFKIPLKYRRKYVLMEKWIVEKYPEAAKYVWQTMRMPVDKHYNEKIYIPKLIDDARTFIVRCINKVARMVNLPLQISFKSDMNPFELWYRTNSEVKNYINNYFTDNINYVTNNELKKYAEEAFAGDARDKIQAINLVAVYKRYING